MRRVIAKEGGDLAIEGLGGALIARTIVQDDLSRRRLEEVLPGTVGVQSSMYAITSQRRRLPARVRAFIEHLKSSLPNALAPRRP